MIATYLTHEPFQRINSIKTIVINPEGIIRRGVLSAERLLQVQGAWTTLK